MNIQPRIDNVQRDGVILTSASYIALIILATVQQAWHVASIAAISFALWIAFSIALRKNSPQWANASFSVIVICAFLQVLYSIALWWLVPITLCALAGWDLMHLHLRTTHIDIAQAPGKLDIILKQHYLRIGVAGGISLIAVAVVNIVDLNLHIGWVLLWLLLAGISIGYILRWVRNRYH